MRLFQTQPAEPAPPEAAPTIVKVFADQTRDFQEIAYPDLQEFQSRGYRLLPPHTNREDLPQPAPESRAIYPTVENMTASSQQGLWANKEHYARQALDAAADQLAARIGRPPIQRPRHGGKREASAIRADDLAQSAITAEAVVKLTERVDALELALDMKGQNDG